MCCKFFKTLGKREDTFKNKYNPKLISNKSHRNYVVIPNIF